MREIADATLATIQIVKDQSPINWMGASKLEKD